MPTRMPKTFKGYPAGVDPKSVRVVRRRGPKSTFMQDLGFTSKNMIKTRYGRERVRVSSRRRVTPFDERAE